MSNANKGGCAFPVLEQSGGGLDCSDAGMSMRDYFAAKAMQASRSRNSNYTSWAELASDAYEIADAMLAAREA